ncbi:hypothetical protein [Qipengyuania spongiae]|uniref:Uncharacterized protein n=1 Tax=Qipengyuania spongiae TaxID=2909673 RepID=A0ABY5T6S7_9SPHN|nr:hypothetical protein [Qipengyuania spongiae]UVI40654.1 hypothetical protein L1F33_06875 [Qipengyuania spongiae]
MMEMIEANWLLILLALVIGIAIAWYVFHAARKTKVTGDRRDVLDEGAAPAARNQALIDAPSGTATPQAPPVVPPATPMGLAGAGEIVSAAAEKAQEETETSAPPAPAPAPVPAPSTTATPTPAPAPAPDPTPTGAGDDLTRLKGVGPKLAAQLGTMGVTSFAQIAAWSDSDVDRIDTQLGRFQGRIRRDNWVEQAGYLARGDSEGFAARYGNLDRG